MQKSVIYSISILRQTVALLLLLVFTPILILLSLVSWIDTGKNPLFIQERGLTLSKFRFKLYKFRTLRASKFSDNSSSKSNAILKKTEYYSYLSSIGKFLRKTGLDELPQLINVLFGQMNFIGPRALSVEDLEKIKIQYPELYNRREKLNIKPGIVGLWQVNKDFDCTVEYLIKLDEEYQMKKSFLLNMKILFKAIGIILFGYHIDAIVNGRKLEFYPILVYVTVLSSLLLLIGLISFI